MISKNGFQLSGHETFVLRRLWLPKVFRYSNKMVKAGLSPNFSGEAPMIDLGLGKNMLSSARFWSIASGMLDKKEVRPSQLAELLFNENGLDLISLKYANGLRNGANSDTHRCKQLTEHGEERCIKLREVAGFSAVRTIFQIVGPRKILHCLLGK